MAVPFHAVVIRAYHTGELSAEVSRTATLVRNALVSEGIV